MALRLMFFPLLGPMVWFVRGMEGAWNACKDDFGDLPEVVKYVFTGE